MIKKVVIFILSLAGCSSDVYQDYTAGDIRGFNHTRNEINRFEVNGYGGGLTGNVCCILLPNKWSNGLKAKVEWIVDPGTASRFPGYENWGKYNAWEKEVKLSLKKYSVFVDIPKYGKSHCGISVHFLTCNRVKVTTTCVGYGTPNYPINEPLNMQEPKTCPK